MSFIVEPIRSGRDMQTFIRFPLQLYRGDPFYTPHLLQERKQFFSAANPLFEFTEAEYFLARDARGRVVGRVSAHVNHRYNDFWRERTGFFGFFECVEDLQVASKLMDEVEASHRRRGLDTVRGPFNFSTNEECGFLAKGFDRPPAIMMPYSRRYYLDFMEALGYSSAKELLAYEYVSGGSIPEHLIRFSERLSQRTHAVVRCLDMRRFEHEVAAAFRLYNSAWEENWGFVPMTEAEFQYAARELKPIIEPELGLIVEMDGVAVGFSLALPDYAIVLRRMKGRVWPFGWWHFLWGRRSIHRARVLLLGVVRHRRRLGLDLLLYYETFRRGLARGYYEGEMSWILDDNWLMRRALERMGAQVGKVYRIYEKKL